MTSEAAWVLCFALASSLTSSGVAGGTRQSLFSPAVVMGKREINDEVNRQETLEVELNQPSESAMGTVSQPWTLPHVGKSMQTFSKEVYGSPSQNKSLRGSSIIRAEHRKDQLLPQDEWNPLEAKALNTLQLLLDKRKNVKKSAENQTGLQKQSVQHVKSLPSISLEEASLSATYLSQRNPISRNRLHLESANRISTYFHPPGYSHCQGRLLAEASMFKNAGSNVGQHYSDLDHLNRPGNKNPYHKLNGFLQNITKPYWLTNRQSPSSLNDFSVFKIDVDSLEVCLTGCKREREEVEAYCSSEFVVNGIVHDIAMIYKGTYLVTLLVNHNGLYKTNRLFLNPDGYFFRVQMLVVDALNCSKLCPDFKLGGRYIVMGRLYHRRRQLPTVLQERVRGRLRPGDGLLCRGNSYMKRFNRRRDQKVQGAARSKCR
ncbi:UPF0450 protein C17orf58 homolog isoform X1 [Python bivittatus]|uniref:UPF0450 protein C17orf58 homolog isoform X1 n=2 Tax=Python bivittatus TaxID=176946 RepID=A0A9F2QYG7_PYTBI|nr:UPF0450 protein C17orf58 homolog isoform X1 [Python bivittatus]